MLKIYDTCDFIDQLPLNLIRKSLLESFVQIREIFDGANVWKSIAFLAKSMGVFFSLLSFFQIISEISVQESDKTMKYVCK